jgi:hypothetical protein
MGEPTRAKLHSKRLADEYVRAGWRVTLEFRVPGDDEPYETILIWPGPGEPVYPESGASVVQRQAEPGPAPDRGGQ